VTCQTARFATCLLPGLCNKYQTTLPSHILPVVMGDLVRTAVWNTRVLRYLKPACVCVHFSRRNTRVWQTDGQTDRQLLLHNGTDRAVCPAGQRLTSYGVMARLRAIKPRVGYHDRQVQKLTSTSSSAMADRDVLPRCRRRPDHAPLHWLSLRLSVNGRLIRQQNRCAYSPRPLFIPELITRRNRLYCAGRVLNHGGLA